MVLSNEVIEEHLIRGPLRRWVGRRQANRDGEHFGDILAMLESLMRQREGSGWNLEEAATVAELPGDRQPVTSQGPCWENKNPTLSPPTLQSLPEPWAEPNRSPRAEEPISFGGVQGRVERGGGWVWRGQ